MLDPFAGGSVRGIVASRMQRRYIGVDLCERQVQANREQGARIGGDPMPVWHCGDARNISSMVTEKADMILTCPPYVGLERYSDDARDLSILGYDEFRKAYCDIIKASCSLLNYHRFAVWVVSEVRGKTENGGYLGLVPDTIGAF